MPIQQPIGGPDVTRRNKRDVLYVEGDGLLTTAKAQRIRKPSGTSPVRVEAGVDGLFNPTTWQFGPGSVLIGESFRISGAGGNIRTRDDAEPDANQFSFVPGIIFNPNGTAFLTVPFLDKMEIVDIFPGPTTSQITATTIGLVVPAGKRRLLESIIFEAGNIGASAPVAFMIYVGTDNSGQKVYEMNHAASDFVADTTVTISIASTVVLEADTQYFIEMVSAIAFSLDLNTLGQVITKFDLHNSRLEEVVTHNRMVNAELQEIVNADLEPVYASQF